MSEVNVEVSERDWNICVQLQMHPTRCELTASRPEKCVWELKKKLFNLRFSFSLLYRHFLSFSFFLSCTVFSLFILTSPVQCLMVYLDEWTNGKSRQLIFNLTYSSDLRFAYQFTNDSALGCGFYFNAEKRNGKERRREILCRNFIYFIFLNASHTTTRELLICFVVANFLCWTFFIFWFHSSLLFFFFGALNSPSSSLL